MEGLRKKINTYKGELTVLFCTAVYLTWFYILERTVTDNYHIIHVALDNYIPFCEYFIVPYLLWFIYVPTVLIRLYRHDRDAFFRACTFLFTGMFISLFICTFYPNGTNFRPRVDADKNIFSAIVALLYETDTCTNVLPSIHVYNSIGVHIALVKSKTFKKKSEKRFWDAVSLLLCISICFATVFLKQHSVVDVFTAMMMAYAVYDVVYEPVADTVPERVKRKLGNIGNGAD